MLLALIFLMSFKCVKSDKIFSMFKSEIGDWNKGTPKVWMSYIRIHLFKHIKKYFQTCQHVNKSCQHVNNVVLQILTRTKLLLLKNKRTTVINKCIFTCILECPVGQFVFYHYTEEDITTFVHWHLNPTLHLNLTFYVIDLFPPNFQFGFAPLIIVQGFSFARDIYVRCFMHKNEHKLFLSGHHSTFSFYSKDNRVKMCIDMYVDVEYSAVGMFMTIDRHAIFNEPIFEKGEKAELIYNIEKKFELFRFFITVHILNKILLEINDSQKQRYLIFDGPSLLSDAIQKRGKVIMTSTFQCLVLLLKPNTNLSHEDYALFTSQKVSIYTQIDISQKNKCIL